MKNSMSDLLCHNCRSNLHKIFFEKNLKSVTSDCKPSLEGISLAACHNCGLIQKPITEKYLEEVKKIYNLYDIYAQGEGAEQLVFDIEEGAQSTRSSKIIKWINENIDIKEEGKLLDIGCGNGGFLKSFSLCRKRWNLVGTEFNSRNEGQINKIPNTKFHLGEIDNLKGKFDLVVIVHLLEHINGPISFLKLVREKLKEDGIIAIQVPNIDQSPFDLVISDHCSHFSLKTLIKVVESANFEVVNFSDKNIPKELSLLARPKKDPILSEENINEEDKILMTLAWLKNLKFLAMKAREPLAIFGSSIAATWMAMEVGDSISFFIDEDINRIGGFHLGLPIKDIKEVAENHPMVIPMKPDLAKLLAKRLGMNKYNFILPDQLYLN